MLRFTSSAAKRSLVNLAKQQQHARLRRVGIISLRVAGVLAVLVTVSVGAVMLILQTRWGGERLRRQLVARVNHQIRGQLAVERLSFGGDRLVLWDVSLRDPDGNQVVQVARAEVDFRVTRLLQKELRLTAVVVESPRLMADSDPAGLNLSRALAPRTKPPPRPTPPPRTREEGWVIRLDRFDLRDGAVLLASTDGVNRKELVHLESLQSFANLRYATGNGSTDLVFRLSGQSVSAPIGPLAIKAEARVRGNQTHLTLDGQLLGGTVQARADIDSQRLEATEALVAIAIPRTELGGYGWGPLRVDGRAGPGAIPELDLLLSIPGLELTAKGGGTDVFKLEGRLAVDDLARTGKAVRMLTTAVVPPLAGHGGLRFSVEGPQAGAPANWQAGCQGLFNHLRVAENAITDLSIDGHAGHLAKIPGEVDLSVAIASLAAGTTKLGKIELGAKVRQQTISLVASLASPEPIRLTLAGQVDGDRQGLALSHLSLSYPKVEWASEGTTHLRFEAQKLSLAGLRLHAQDQALTADGTRDDERVDAHVALTKFRVDLLPTLVVPRDLNLGGSVDLDVKANGEVTNPKVVVQLRLEQGRVRTFSRIASSIDATLADRRVDGTLNVHAPFMAMDGGFHLPVDPVAGGALNLRLGVERLDLGEALRGSGVKPELAGRLTARLRVTGSAASPKVVLAVTGNDLNVRRSVKAAEGPSAVDVGHARLDLSYEDREAHAEVEFASAHGGELRVDASARVDLAYPAVTEGIDAKKIPVHGKVMAKDFDVAWLSHFNDQVEALGGRVSADAKVAGTVGNPQFIGDVRWKNGKVVTVAARKVPNRR
jgi:autotransporter translocation and assembly factor TamB